MEVTKVEATRQWRRMRPWLRRLAVSAVLFGALLFVACDGAGGSSQAGATPDVRAATPSSDDEALEQSLSPGWNTNFELHSVPLEEIVSGGPGKDGIPAIDDPKFVDTAAADEYLRDQEPVIAFQLNSDARAYPLQILIWHEMVNDVVGGKPVLVTFCPLCGTAHVFERTVDGVTYDFGTTGRLLDTDLVMYDRQTESWWQQTAGDAIVGDLTGTQLSSLPASIISWGDFKKTFPLGKVLSRDTGFSRPYGRNPYTGYDDIDSSPFLFNEASDPRLPPIERVVTVTLGGEDAAYPFSVLEEKRVVNDTVGGRPVAVFFAPGSKSALDRDSVGDSQGTGASGVFVPEVNGQSLTFRAAGDAIVDEETGSTWDVLGKAVDGELKGEALEPVVHGDYFWFIWAVFKPDTRVYSAASP